MSPWPSIARLILWRGKALTLVAAGVVFALVYFVLGWPLWATLLAVLATGALTASSCILNSKHTSQIEGLVAQLMRVNHRLNGEIQHRAQIEIELASARDEALELVHLKSQFLATMSHEIRTPMNGIIGMTHLILETELTGEQREYTEAIRKCSDNLMVIIDDILDFAKIEAGTLNLQRQEFSPLSIIEGSIDLLKSRAESKKLSLKQEISKNIPEVLIGDPPRLRQMLVILIGNAIKFTEQGEICVSARADDSATLRIDVRDTGIGISSEKQARLFDSFYQSDGADTRKHGGAGLGLAICKRLAVSMGGDVTVDSRPGMGSTFHLTVVLERPESLRNQGVSNLSGKLVESKDLVKAGV